MAAGRHKWYTVGWIGLVVAAILFGMEDQANDGMFPSPIKLPCSAAMRAGCTREVTRKFQKMRRSSAVLAPGGAGAHWPAPPRPARIQTQNSPRR
jgi:hypothetical protein